MMEEHGKVKSIKSRKHSYGSSLNVNMICYTDEQETEETIVKIKEGKQWSYAKAISKKKLSHTK